MSLADNHTVVNKNPHSRTLPTVFTIGPGPRRANRHFQPLVSLPTLRPSVSVAKTAGVLGCDQSR